MKKLVVVCAACGIGKSTVKDESKYHDDCLEEAVKMSGNKNLLFVSCLHPIDFYSKVEIPAEITATYFVALTCSAEEIRNRLKARPAERMCGSDEFIEAQVEYNAWIKESTGKFQFYIDNTDIPVEETAAQIAEFVNHL